MQDQMVSFAWESWRKKADLVLSRKQLRPFLFLGEVIIMKLVSLLSVDKCQFFSIILVKHNLVIRTSVLMEEQWEYWILSGIETQKIQVLCTLNVHPHVGIMKCPKTKSAKSASIVLIIAPAERKIRTNPKPPKGGHLISTKKTDSQFAIYLENNPFNANAIFCGLSAKRRIK